MIGFFEHQYRSYKKNHLRNLLALARADGNLHPDEVAFLFKVGRNHGLKDRHIQSIIDEPSAQRVPIPESHDGRMNLLYDLLLMIHADSEVAPGEVAFLEDIVTKLGMKREVVAWLLDVFQGKGIPPLPDDWQAIKQEAGERFSVS